jgi:hypothetical protein
MHSKTHRTEAQIREKSNQHGAKRNDQADRDVYEGALAHPRKKRILRRIEVQFSDGVHQGASTEI